LNKAENPGEIILVDKPLFWTSFAVVGYYKHLLKPIKVGHAGTLDPLATGLLLLCTGKKTKEISTIQQMPKVYTGRFILGYTSASYDLETETIPSFVTDIDEEKISEAVKTFEGDIIQIPPAHSAIKVDGVRSYEMIRLGVELEIKPRWTTVYKFEVQKSGENIYNFEVCCSKGTYIRTLINDLGTKLGCGALLIELRRTMIGDYNVDNANKIDTLNVHRGGKIKDKVYHIQDSIFLQKINFNSEGLL